jgi:hypothetical protein
VPHEKFGSGSTELRLRWSRDDPAVDVAVVSLHSLDLLREALGEARLVLTDRRTGDPAGSAQEEQLAAYLGQLHVELSTRGELNRLIEVTRGARNQIHGRDA